MDYKRIIRESITGAVKHQDVTENEVDAAGKHVENVPVEESTSSSKLAENAEPAISKDEEYKTTDAGQDVGVPKDAKAFKDKKEFVSEDADTLKDCSDKAECKIDFKKVMEACAKSKAKEAKRMRESDLPKYGVHYDYYEDGMPDEATDNRKEAEGWFKDAVEEGYDHVMLLWLNHGSYEVIKEFNSNIGIIDDFRESSYRRRSHKLREARSAKPDRDTLTKMIEDQFNDSEWYFDDIYNYLDNLQDAVDKVMYKNNWDEGLDVHEDIRKNYHFEFVNKYKELFGEMADELLANDSIDWDDNDAVAEAIVNIVEDHDEDYHELEDTWYDEKGKEIAEEYHEEYEEQNWDDEE